MVDSLPVVLTTVRLRNAADNSCAKVVTGNRGSTVFSVAFAPNGKIIASDDDDGTGSVRLKNRRWRWQSLDGQSFGTPRRRCYALCIFS